MSRIGPESIYDESIVDKLHYFAQYDDEIKTWLPSERAGTEGALVVLPMYITDTDPDSDEN